MRKIATVAVVAWLAAACLVARPRGVGDASEYVAMAWNLARGGPPALSASEFDAFNRAFAGDDAGFELHTRRLPELQGRDGRYDMPHMWLYSALAVPGVRVANILGWSPAWAFVALNVLLVALLAGQVLRHGGGPWTTAIVFSPVVWWLDKPLADLLIATLLGLAVLAWPRRGEVSLVLLGLAAAQNPGLTVAAAAFGGAALLQSPGRVRERRWWLGGALAIACAALAPAYYRWHLGRLSPLTTYAVAHVPSVSSLLFPLADTNMGALFRIPPLGLIVGLALLRRAGWTSPAALPAALSAVALLVVVSQQPNMNQGGNPDLSRYAVWLLPLALPWLLSADASPRRATRLLGIGLCVVTAAWTAAAFRPSRPESYRYPTALASWLWTQHPSWTVPRPEAFSERTSHREPGLVPTATPGCEKVLLSGGAWPGSCPPADNAPPSCVSPGVLCYADARRDGGYTFTHVGPQALQGLVVHDRTWPGADADSAWVRHQVARGRAAG